MCNVTASTVFLCQKQPVAWCNIARLFSNHNFLQVRSMTKSTVTSLFQPLNIVPKESEKSNIIKSQRLMIDIGLIRPSSPGMFNLLPLAVRSIQKLTDLIDGEMEKIGAHKLLLPSLTEARLWKATGRWESIGPELYKLKDRHGSDYVLSPTHEEAVTDLVASIFQLSHHQLPLRLYQISNKFRDEMKPRFGLLRCKEFLMKDLYTFDVSEEKAEESYRLVSEAYDNLFQKLGVRFIKVLGATGNIGGSLSHEYHLLASVGEDELFVCDKCGYGANVQVLEGAKLCPGCKSQPLTKSTGIEVGHTFLLGTKYSQVLNSIYMNDKGKPDVTVMGCYGLGVTRILAACIEVLSTEEEVRWPVSIAPYKVCIIPPKHGSQEEAASVLADSCYDNLNSMPGLSSEVILDDRNQFTIGRRLLEARRTGYPYILVFGKKALDAEPRIELFDVNTGREELISLSDVQQYLKSAT